MAAPQKDAKKDEKRSEGQGGEKPRTWAEQHGGVIYIGAAFLLIAALVVVKLACN